MARQWPPPDQTPPVVDPAIGGSMAAVTDPVTATGTAVLPPAGDEQRDILRERLDRLEAQMAAQTTTEAIDPRAFEIDREIAQHLAPVNLLEVTGKQDGWRYKWVHTGQHSYFVKWAGAQGWEIVSGDDPESRESKDVTGARRIGDVILMRIPEDRAVRLDRAEAVKRDAQQRGVGGRLEELAQQYRHTGLVVHTDMATMNPRIAQAMHARAMSTNRFDTMLRTGTVPGAPAPR